MWAGCIWVPIYEVMTRKHLTLVTLEENLELAADIGIDATTSLDEAFGAAMGRHGPDAKVAVLPFARYQLPRNAVRMHAEDAHVFDLAAAPLDGGRIAERTVRGLDAPGVRPDDAPAEIRGSTHDRRDPAHVSRRRGGAPAGAPASS